MSEQLYFQDQDAEYCEPLNNFHDLMEDEGWDEMVVYKAVRADNKDFFWCSYLETTLERNPTTGCGKDCKGYQPRNGKSGICKHHSLKFYEPGEAVTIYRK